MVVVGAVMKGEEGRELLPCTHTNTKEKEIGEKDKQVKIEMVRG